MGHVLTKKSPLWMWAVNRHASDWNSWRMVESPIMMIRLPRRQAWNCSALNSWRSHACGLKIFLYSCAFRNNAHQATLSRSALPEAVCCKSVSQVAPPPLPGARCTSRQCSRRGTHSRVRSLDKWRSG